MISKTTLRLDIVKLQHLYQYKLRHGVRLSKKMGKYVHTTQLDQPHLSESEDHHFEFAFSSQHTPKTRPLECCKIKHIKLQNRYLR
jgi:hypothetical protein